MMHYTGLCDMIIFLDRFGEHVTDYEEGRGIDDILAFMERSSSFSFFFSFYPSPFCFLNSFPIFPVKATRIFLLSFKLFWYRS